MTEAMAQDLGPSILVMLINAASCAGVVWACLCRLNLTNAETPSVIRLQFVLLLAGHALSGLSPLLGVWPSIGQALGGASVMAYLLLGMARWSAAFVPEQASDWSGLDVVAASRHDEASPGRT